MIGHHFFNNEEFATEGIDAYSSRGQEANFDDTIASTVSIAECGPAVGRDAGSDHMREVLPFRNRHCHSE
jgi:hypothetical protein